MTKGKNTAKLTTGHTLANRWRPRTWDDVCGHVNVVSRLKGMLESQTLPNAILFAGPSGTGKTTLSRVFARYINCEHGTSCGECESCRMMDNGTHFDYEEVDAGSSGGINDIRNLIDRAQKMPMIGNIRIIVVDEAQCFPPDAKVLMEDGSSKNICDVRVGDKVRTFDHTTGEESAATVSSTMKRVPHNKEMVAVHIEGCSQECTADHLWWSVTRNKYVRADQLLEGEEVLVSD